MAPNEPTRRRRPNKKLILTLVVVVIAMGGFGYALVPLYNIVCKLTGLNGKTGGINRKAVAAIKIDTHRWVKVEFFTSLNQEMPWTFKPVVAVTKVHPGQLESAGFYTRNDTDEVMTGQAVDSVIPSTAAPYLKKLLCVCFKNHTLQPHQAKTFLLKYIVMPGLPKSVHTIYFSYTFFKVSAHPVRPTQAAEAGTQAEPVGG